MPLWTVPPCTCWTKHSFAAILSAMSSPTHCALWRCPHPCMLAGHWGERFQVKGTATFATVADMWGNAGTGTGPQQSSEEHLMQQQCCHRCSRLGCSGPISLNVPQDPKSWLLPGKPLRFWNVSPLLSAWPVQQVGLPNVREMVVEGVVAEVEVELIVMYRQLYFVCGVDRTCAIIP